MTYSLENKYQDARETPKLIFLGVLSRCGVTYTILLVAV